MIKSKSFVAAVLLGASSLSLWSARATTTAPQHQDQIPASIRLPKLDTDEDRLRLLLTIKSRIPDLFSTAANYDVDLLGILGDQQKLVSELLKHPSYARAFEGRKHASLVMTPPKGGVVVAQSTIKETAVEAWKAALAAKVGALVLQAQGEGADLYDLRGYLNKRIQATFDALGGLDLKESFQELNRTIQTGLGREKSNHELINPINGSKTLSPKEKLWALKQLHDEGKLKGSEAILPTLKKAIFVSHLADLMQVSLAMDRANFRYGTPIDPSPDQAREAIRKFTVDDLIYFTDRNETLLPQARLVLEEMGRVEDSAKPTRLSALVEASYREIVSYSNQVEKSAQTVKNPVRIAQVAPYEAIYRGMTGGDCSSTFSFPYPNDPNERVFFVSDSEGKLKGYVSATIVEAGPEKIPALYVITISGNRINAGDTHLILAGLHKMSAQLGVQQVLLPPENKLHGLINFPQPKGVYLESVKGQKSTEIRYRNPELRSVIQNFLSKNNKATYDHMASNTQGVVYQPRADFGKIEVEFSEKAIEPPNPQALSRDSALEFALDMSVSKRTKIADRVLTIPGVDISQGQFKKTLRALQNTSNPRRPLNTKEFLASVKKSLQALGVKDPDAVMRKDYLLSDGLLRAPDAFSQEHAEQTAAILTKKLKLMQLAGILDNTFVVDKLLQYRDEFRSTQAAQKYLAKMKTGLFSGDWAQMYNAERLFVGLDTCPELTREETQKLLTRPDPYVLQILVRSVLSSPYAQDWTHEKETARAQFKALVSKSLPGQTADQVVVLKIASSPLAANWQEENELARKTIEATLSDWNHLVADTAGKSYINPEGIFSIISGLEDAQKTEAWSPLFNRSKEALRTAIPKLPIASLPRVIGFSKAIPRTDWAPELDLVRARFQSLKDQELPMTDALTYTYTLDHPQAIQWKEETKILRTALFKALQKMNTDDLLVAASLFELDVSRDWHREKNLIIEKIEALVGSTPLNQLTGPLGLIARLGEYYDFTRALDRVVDRLIAESGQASVPDLKFILEIQTNLRNNYPHLKKAQDLTTAVNRRLQALAPSLDLEVMWNLLANGIDHGHDPEFRKVALGILRPKLLESIKTGAKDLASIAWILKMPLSVDWKEERGLLKKHLLETIPKADSTSFSALGPSVAALQDNPEFAPEQALLHKRWQELASAATTPSELGNISFFLKTSDPSWTKENQALVKKVASMIDHLETTELAAASTILSYSQPPPTREMGQLERRVRTLIHQTPTQVPRLVDLITLGYFDKHKELKAELSNKISEAISTSQIEDLDFIQKIATKALYHVTTTEEHLELARKRIRHLASKVKVDQIHFIAGLCEKDPASWAEEKLLLTRRIHEIIKSAPVAELSLLVASQWVRDVEGAKLLRRRMGEFLDHPVQTDVHIWNNLLLFPPGTEWTEEKAFIAKILAEPSKNHGRFTDAGSSPKHAADVPACGTNAGGVGEELSEQLKECRDVVDPPQ